jgi:shikimate kinase
VIERIALVGFMGAGKTVVGRRLAGRLGWRHLDLDDEVERLAGRSVATIFARQGEAAFREMEADATRRLAMVSGVVISTGGGWVTQPEAFRMLGPAAVHVWLRVGPEIALARVTGPRSRRRPLLEVPDPAATILRMLRDREPLYSRAEIVVETDGLTPGQVAVEIARLMQPRLTRRGDDTPGRT